jgi:hypothetical protein
MIDSTLKGIAKVLLSVEEHNDPSLTEKKLTKCNNCPLLNKKRRICNACGCFVDIKATLKTNINTKNFIKGDVIEETHCPMGYWDDKELANKYRKIYNLSLLP